MLRGDTRIVDVEVTKHALQRTDGGEKSKCRAPESVLKKIVRQRKGRQFYDSETDTMHFVKAKTVVVADYTPEDDLWSIVTAYRMDNPLKRMGRRYSDVDPGDFKESRRQEE